MELHNPRLRYSLFAIWLLIVVAALYLYFFQRDVVQAELRNALSASFWVAVVAYLLIGSLRAFTLVPVPSRCWWPCRSSIRGCWWP